MKNIAMSDYTVVNFSGGKDSTAMLLRMIELGARIDEVICGDTGKEFPAMYRHIEKVKRAVEGRGIKFTLLKSEKSFDYYLFDHAVTGAKNPRLAGLQGKSWPTGRARWCTGRLKIDVMNRYLRELRARFNVIQCVGLAADEVRRLNRKNNQQEARRHPLVEWGWTEADCLKYCYDHGYDWEGLYEVFNRVSCWCCPLQPLSELRKLRANFPGLWEELKAMDRRTWGTFRADYSVEDLDMRFQFEEERLEQGLPITNKDFHTKLKARLFSAKRNE